MTTMKASDLPSLLNGHWRALDGYEMAKRYASRAREDLCGGESTDMLVAFEIADLRRDDFNFESTLATARDRIRWLSVQLALEKATNAELLTAFKGLLEYAEQMMVNQEGERGSGRSLEQLDAAGDIDEEIISARAAIAKATGAK